MSETTKPAAPQIDQSNLKTSYANVCRIAQTPNEVIVDFGMNPNFFGNILDEPLKLDNRIIMSHDAAKRLCLHLMATIQNFEQRYGTIELDVTKRLKQQPQAPAAS
jgi:adenine-specific DNA methylase